MPSIEEILADELSEAVNNLIIEEGDDDQDKLREMILSLQIQAFKRGLDMGVKSPDAVDEVVVGMDAQDATNMISEMLRSGSATVRFMVNQ